MITRDEAIAAAEAFLNADGEDIEAAIMRDATLEYEFGWVFFYNSREYLETKKFEDMLVGNAPLIFEKTTGRIVETGTAEPVETYVEAFRKTGDPHARLGASVRIYGSTDGATTVDGVRVLRRFSMLGLADAKAEVETVLAGGETTVSAGSIEAADDMVHQLTAHNFLAEQLFDRYGAQRRVTDDGPPTTRLIRS